ncbi:hypothetical protein GCK72_015864 [Caenorhabditis remanei]|uniref:Uncharacterized protein n=1 Tax=Caenorhabditis remanei TaxID=31234 RepID=A0A6A5GW64_CAERE|nr:hypothetical protein GCK72_015864 [Caenorhabditis remanei]KAF1759397.1 hypothetical protein GCK72_015864 [Caenorhabditis remanei]
MVVFLLLELLVELYDLLLQVLDELLLGVHSYFAMSIVTNDIPAQPIHQDKLIYLTFSQLHHLDRLCIKYLCRSKKDDVIVSIPVASIMRKTRVPRETVIRFYQERRRAWRNALHLKKDESNLNLSSGPILKISEGTDDETVTLTFDQLHRLGHIYEDSYEKGNRKFQCSAEEKEIVERLETLKLSVEDLYTFFLTRRTFEKSEARQTFEILEVIEETDENGDVTVADLKKQLEEQEKELNEAKAKLKHCYVSIKSKKLEIESLKKTVETITIENNGNHQDLCFEKSSHAETKTELKAAKDSVKAKDQEIESLTRTVKNITIEKDTLLCTEKSRHAETKSTDHEIESLKKKIGRITIEKDALYENLSSEEEKHAETRKGLCNAYIFNAKVLENLKETTQSMKDSEEKKVNDLESKLQEKQDELNNTVKLYWNLEKIITGQHCETLMEKKYGAEKKAMEKKIQELEEKLKTQNSIFKKMQDVIYN